MPAFDLFRDLLGLRTVPLPGAQTLDCICTLNCGLTFGGFCRRFYDATHEAVIEDRDGWLTEGFTLPTLVLLPEPDRRGLPRYRIQAASRSTLHA